MENSIELEEFKLSFLDTGLSLSASSRLFTADHSDSQLPSEDILQLIQDKQLWFQPPTVCHLQIIIRLNQIPMGASQRQSRILEYIAGSICQSTLWPMLGLSIDLAKWSYETETEESPNLYFRIEHPDKSPALLSPPHMETSSMRAVLCLFDFQAASQDVSVNAQVLQKVQSWQRSERDGESRDCTLLFTPRINMYDANTMVENGGLGEDHSTTPTTATADSRQRRRQIAALSDAAMHRIVGLRKKFQGIQLNSIKMQAPLLEIAPAVWNAHYMQRTAAHNKDFPALISTIMAARSWSSPSLATKISTLSNNRDPFSADGISGFEQTARPILQEKLWTLLQTTLRITAGTQSALKEGDVESRRDLLEDLEAQLFPEETEDIHMNEFDTPHGERDPDSFNDFQYYPSPPYTSEWPLDIEFGAGVLEHSGGFNDTYFQSRAADSWDDGDMQDLETDDIMYALDDDLVMDGDQNHHVYARPSSNSHGVHTHLQPFSAGIGSEEVPRTALGIADASTASDRHFDGIEETVGHGENWRYSSRLGQDEASGYSLTAHSHGQYR